MARRRHPAVLAAGFQCLRALSRRGVATRRSTEKRRKIQDLYRGNQAAEVARNRLITAAHDGLRELPYGRRDPAVRDRHTSPSYRLKSRRERFDRTRTVQACTRGSPRFPKRGRSFSRVLSSLAQPAPPRCVPLIASGWSSAVRKARNSLVFKPFSPFRSLSVEVGVSTEENGQRFA
jgi:hypothetical protein